MCPFVVSLFIVFGPPKAAPILFLLSPEVSGTSGTMSIYIYIYVGFRAKTRLRAYAHNCQETEKT